MGLESATYINGLDAANPVSGDSLGQADDHMRLIKSTIKNTFPNINAAMNASDEELNFIVGQAELVTTGLEKAAPKGSIVMWPTGTAPTQWLLCDGSAVSRTTYADLFAVISDDYGNGDGSTTFNLPDFRGEFVRGTDNAAGIDPDAASRTDRGDATTGDNVGTKQADAFDSHSHTITVTNGPSQIKQVGSAGEYDLTNGIEAERAAVTASAGAAGGNETRPRNIGMNFIIKY